MQYTPKDYPGIPHALLKDDSRLKNLNYENPKLDNVEKAFKKIAKSGNFLAVNVNKFIKKRRYNGGNRGGTVAKTHFQGMSRVRNGRSFIFSGGDYSDSAAQIFSATVDHFRDNINFPAGMSNVVKGKILRGPIGSNLFDDGDAPDSDKLNFITQINDRVVDGEDGKGYWHAGGVSVAGDILAVPLESNDASMIRFFSIKNPNKPVHLKNCDIPRPKTIGKAGTASLCRLSNDRYLCAVWQDGKKRGDQNIDFYVSKDGKLENGFKTENIRWNYKNLAGLRRLKTKYQVLEFAVQSDDQIYLVGTENTSPLAPKIDAPGDDVAELLKFSCDLSLIDQPKKFRKSIQLSLANRRVFAGSDRYHNFKAGAGIYITPEKELLMYAVYHYRRDREVRFVEFAPKITSYKDEVTDISRGKIELYEKENFKGRVIRIYGRAGSRIDDYKNCFTQEDDFGKGVGSIKFILPANSTYSFYKDKNCKGNPIFFMDGTGFYKEVKKIGKVGDKVMSSKFTKI